MGELSILSDSSSNSVRRMSACLSVSDIKRSAEWYQNVLGFRPFLEKNFARFGAQVAYLQRGDFQIELVENKNFSPDRPPDPPLNTEKQGISQITFRVDRIDHIYEEMKKSDVEIAMRMSEVEDIHIKAFFIRDNEGNLIEFLEMD